MEREEFEDHKWVCPFGQFSSASSGGRGMTTGGDLVQRHGVHAVLLSSKRGQGPHDSYSSDDSSSNSQQRPMGRGGYSIPLVSSQQLSTPRSCFGCRSPDHMIQSVPCRLILGLIALILQHQLETQHYHLEVQPYRLGAAVEVMLTEVGTPEAEEQMIPSHIWVVERKLLLVGMGRPVLCFPRQTRG